MSVEITDEVVEVAAKALCAVQQPDGAWDRFREYQESYRDIFRNEARAVLEAALPLILANKGASQ